MASVQPIASVAQCYAQALMIEGEAAERCKEFAEFLEDRGELATAALFRKLARYEQHHANELARRAAAHPLPRLPQWEFSWLDDAPPERVSHEIVFHLMTAEGAIRIALGAEERARALFERIARTTDDPELSALARGLAAEENEYIHMLKESLGAMPRWPVSDADFERFLHR